MEVYLSHVFKILHKGLTFQSHVKKWLMMLHLNNRVFWKGIFSECSTEQKLNIYNHSKIKHREIPNTLSEKPKATGADGWLSAAFFHELLVSQLQHIVLKCLYLCFPITSRKKSQRNCLHQGFYWLQRFSAGSLHLLDLIGLGIVLTQLNLVDLIYAI